MKINDLNMENIPSSKTSIIKTGYASIDQPWFRFYPEDMRNYKIPEMSIYQLLEENGKNMLNNKVMRYFDIAITYRKYLKNISNSAKSLKNMGTKKNEIVLLGLPNIPECRILIYALNILGAISYPINPMLPQKEFDRITSENEVKTIFMFDRFYKKYENTLLRNERLKNVVVLNGEESIPEYILELKKFVDRINHVSPNEQPLLPFNSRNMDWKEFASLKKGVDCPVPFYEPDHVATIIGTSGTTGTSKGVMITNENLNAMALQHKYGQMNFETGEKLLDILIQSIGYGIAVAHYSGVCGLESILVPELVKDITPYLEKYQISHFTGGPTHYETLAKKVNAGYILPPTKNMVSGGASLDKKIEKTLNKVEDNYIETSEQNDVYVRQGLGCTENAGAATYAKKGAYKFGGVGIPLVLENMGIFKPGTDIELKYGEEGEICICGPTVMKGYLNNEEETNEVLKRHRDGKIWLHTRDLGFVDCDGQFYITDRLKDIFMRGGFNVHPSIIEEFISNLNGVDTCKVVGVSHPTEQTVPIAFVKLNDEDNIFLKNSYILQECYDNLEEVSIPYEIFFVDSLPTNLGGKVDTNYILKQLNIDYSKNSKQKEAKLIKLKK